MGLEVSVDFVWETYVCQTVSLQNLRQQTLESILNSHAFVYPEFQNKSYNEIDDLFSKSKVELEYLTCFSLVASTEAYLKNRFNFKGKDKISKEFKRIRNKNQAHKSTKISLKEDILKTIKLVDVSTKKEIDLFIELLNFRNWIAHGRSWNKTGNKIYTPNIVFEIVTKLLQKLD